MNRKERRQQKKLAKQGPADTGEMLDGIVGAYGEGRMEDALDGCRKVLAQDPDNFDILNLAGGLNLHFGQYQEALDLLQRAAEISPNNGDVLLNLGHALFRTERFEEALGTFERAVIVMQSPELYYNMAATLQALGRFEDAVVAYGHAITLDPGYTDALNNQGNTYSALGRLAEAEDSYRKAIATAPGAPQGHNNLGNLLRMMDRREEALQELRQAIALDPEYANGHFNLGSALLGGGDYGAALDSFRTAVSLAPDNTDFWRGLAVGLAHGADAGHPDGKLLNELKGCLVQEGIDPYPLDTVIVEATRHTPEVIDLLQRAADGAMTASKPEELVHAAAVIVEQPIAISMMLDSLAAADLEGLITTLRRELLIALRGDSSGLYEDANVFGLLCVLAHQGFLNEFTFAESAQESALIAVLENDLATALETSSVAAAPLALYGAYRPLKDAPFAAALEGGKIDPDIPLTVSMLTMHIVNPAKESALAAAIKPLTRIDDDVSRAVRRQYEENPYPLWQRVDRLRSSPLAAVMGDLFPGWSSRRGGGWPAAPRILVAGCGTGKQAIDAAMRFSGAEVLALDLSLSSLAYGKRRADEMGLENLRFAQADILGLEAHRDRYDMILASGVLHHMQDPLKGWGILTGLLNPGGLMKIGLYSELARCPVAAAQAFARAGGGYPASADGIRAFRQAVLALPEGDPVRGIVMARDFYSLSECRDLVFHVQERCFSIPEIERALAQLGLGFIGFEFADRAITEAYRQRFTDDGGGALLENWHAFEQGNPAVFAAMYQFWAEKPA